MKRTIHAIQYAVIGLSWLIIASTALAASSKTPVISPGLYKRLQQIETLMSKQAYLQAIKNTHKLLPELKANSYEKALVLRTQSSIYALQNNYTQAIRALKQCLEIQALPDHQQLQSVLNLGQLYMATEQYQQAIKTLKPWLSSQTVQKNNELLVLIAHAYAQLKQYRQALPYIKRAIRQTKKPPQSWLQFNLAVYYELEAYKPAAALLTQLLARSPDNKNYWQQLASIYQQLKQFRQALSVQHLAYQKGLLKTETEILQLVNLFIYNQLPYQAGQLLQQALTIGQVHRSINNLTLLANTWYQARAYSRAIQTMDQAAKLSAKGKLYFQLARLQVEQQQWQAAIKVVKQALNKGGLGKQIGNAYILLGTSLYEIGQVKAAKQAFRQAKQFNQTQYAANQWLQYLVTEKF